MKFTFFKKVSVFRALPFSIRRKILLYYLHRITFTRSRNSEIIWTSFYYFALTQPIQIKENRNDYLISFRYAKRNLNLLVRKGQSSDIFVFFQVFIRDEYSPFFNQIRIQGEFPNSCLDAGANVGYFAVAMLCWFPTCKVISIEPDQGNYAMLLRNVELNGLIGMNVPVHAALWVRDTKLFLKKESIEEWAYAVTEEITADGECEALSLSTISTKSSDKGFDVIKIDVEGAEQQLFDDSDFLRGLQSANVIGLEIHDDKANRKEIEGSLHRLGYAISNQGELTLAVKAN